MLCTSSSRASPSADCRLQAGGQGLSASPPPPPSFPILPRHTHVVASLDFPAFLFSHPSPSIPPTHPYGSGTHILNSDEDKTSTLPLRIYHCLPCSWCPSVDVLIRHLREASLNFVNLRRAKKKRRNQSQMHLSVRLRSIGLVSNSGLWAQCGGIVLVWRVDAQTFSAFWQHFLPFYVFIQLPHHEQRSMWLF